MRPDERQAREIAIRQSRERFERSLDRLGGAVESELGFLPRYGRWLGPLVAGALGLTAALVLRRNLPRLRDRT